MHPERRRRTRELEDLAGQGRHEELYQLLMLREFSLEARMGWQLAFLRPFAVPRMAKILVHAGQLVDDPEKRTFDTGLIIYEIVHGGIESDRARQMVSLMNRAHHGRGINPEDMTYVLCAFIVTPLRHIDLIGWRPLADHEKQSAVVFFGRLGQLMNIRTIPSTYAEAENFYDAYEAKMVAPSKEGKLLGTNLIKVLRALQPPLLRPILPQLFTALLADPAIARAIGLRPLTSALQRTIVAAVKAQGAAKRILEPSSRPLFTPGMVIDGPYPHGYALHDLGASR